MLAVIAFLKVWWKPITAVVVVGVWSAWVYVQGQDDVQQKWDAQTARIAQALVKNAEAQRAKEYADQQQMNKVQADATQRLEALRTDADSANAAANGLRQQVGKLLTTDGVRKASGTCTSRPATENPGNLLAVVLDKSVERNKELARFADAAITAAQACAAGHRAVQ